MNWIYGDSNGNVLVPNANSRFIGQWETTAAANPATANYFVGMETRLGSDRNLVLVAKTGDTGGNIIFQSGNTGIGTVPERARIDTSGRLLLGTSSSASAGNASVARIQIVGNSTDAAASSVLALNRGEAATSITSGETIGNITFGDSSGNEFGLIQCIADATAGSSDYPGRLVFSTTADGASSPTERMRLTSGGLFKVQTQGASYENATAGVNELSGSVNDTLMLFRNTSGTITSARGGIDILYSVANPNSTTASFIQCNSTGPTLRAEIRSNGGLANYSANNANLSDRNAKKDITPAAGTWDCIKDWEIVNYRYKDQPDDADLNLGVIAQQVAERCPEVITVFSEAKDAKPAVLDDDGNEIEPAQEAQPEKLGVKEQQMYWMAIKALQEAQVRIEALETEVAALKAQ